MSATISSYTLMPPGRDVEGTFRQKSIKREGAEGSSGEDYVSHEWTEWPLDHRLPLKHEPLPNSKWKTFRLYYQNAVSNFGLLKTESSSQGLIRSHTATISFKTDWMTLQAGHVGSVHNCQLPVTLLTLLTDSLGDLRMKTELPGKGPPEAPHVLVSETASLTFETDFGDHQVPTHLVEVKYEITLDPPQEGDLLVST